MDLEGTVKVADFGLAKGFYDKVYFRQEKNVSVKLPVKWLALESIQYGLFSEKSDVVSIFSVKANKVIHVHMYMYVVGIWSNDLGGV